MERLIYLVNMEKFVYWCIIQIVFSFMLVRIDTYIFKNLFDIEITKKKGIVFVIICSLLRSILFILAKFPYFAVSYFILELLLLKVITKEKFEKCVVAMTINYSLQIIIEIVFSFVFLKVIHESQNYISVLYSCKYLLFSYICVTILKIACCIIIKKKSLVLEVQNNLSRKDKNTIIVCSMISNMVIFSSSMEVFYHLNYLPHRIMILYILGITMYFFLIIQHNLKIITIHDNTYKINGLESYNKTLSLMYDNIRGFKHDFSNLVQALDGYARTNDLEGIKKMTGSIISDCKSINNMEILNSSLINNPAIHSIITSKYYLAQKENVEMNIEISVDLSETNGCSYEISRILAILLDNAIEAAKECDEKIVNLRCVMDTKVKRKLVIIENTYKHKDIDVEKIFEKGYTIKDDTKNEHGLGLWTVRKTLNKLDNVNLFTTKGEHFCQQLEIYT